MGSKLRVAELPKCNFCNEDAKFDAPTKQGPWAYMCIIHADEYGLNVITIGIEFVLGIAEPVGGNPIQGILDFDRSISEDMLIITCPECTDEKHLELDAGGTYICAGCGRTITIPTLI